MTPLFTKLNLKQQKEIVVLNAPVTFEPELTALVGVNVHRSFDASPDTDFFLVFTTQKSQTNAIAPALTALAKGDAILWFAYPKGTSKRFQCDFNRDNGWDALVTAGFQTVRAVSIDDDWTALRFRRNEFVKSR